MSKVPWVFAVILFAFTNFEGLAKNGKEQSDDGNIFVGGEPPFDAVNIFGDLGRSIKLPNTDENIIWWERMIRGEVGRDRFLVLCALKDGNWKRMGDIRDYIEFQMRDTYGMTILHELLLLMAGKPFKHTSHFSEGNHGNMGEGWLERSHEADPNGIASEWRIAPSVHPLLYFLLMGCPEDNRCQ